MHFGEGNDRMIGGARDLICSSHTISGVLPGSAVPSRHSFTARVEACARAGYAGMCLHFRDYRALKAAGASERRLRGVLDRHRMRHISLEFLNDWFLEGTDAEASRADEMTAYEAARAFGAKSLNVGPDLKERGIPVGMMRNRFRELSERAGDRGLSVALEIVAWGNVHDVDTALEIINGIPNAGLVIDSWHIFRGGVPLRDVERIPADNLLCIQVNDARAAIGSGLAADTLHRLPCGEGTLDLKGFMTCLNRSGSGVPVSVEIISAEFAALELADAARISYLTTRNMLDTVGAEPRVEQSP